MAIKDKAVATLVSNRFLSNQSLGMSALDSAVDTFETVINSLVDIIADRNEKIRVLEALALELGDKSVNTLNQDMVKQEAQGLGWDIIPWETVPKVKEYWRCAEPAQFCGFTHQWVNNGFTGDKYCPNCGGNAELIQER